MTTPAAVQICDVFLPREQTVEIYIIRYQGKKKKEEYYLGIEL